MTDAPKKILVLMLSDNVPKTRKSALVLLCLYWRC
ncbi:hypothetical protein BVRB_3g065600 [Beta vulgaris subsp. vulgaris]|uniref:Uncharacterized protein n=1 Tax=Beta vulgaris subsp. vulgaris TaxID=3555 RepID=A0A0J8FG83_BETVV|nr:hypothetical protein BVRB_3g065600 [Beta vulgaris subsp. vulgaris]